MTPEGEIPPSGRQARTGVCEVSRVRDGQIVSLHLYWDNLELMHTIGAMPGGAGIPSSA